MGQNIFVFKVPFVGTLNLCLKMPDTEQKTRNQSDHQELRKRQKTAEICRVSKIDVFHHFFDIFRLNSRLLLCVRHLDTQVQSTHKGFFLDLSPKVMNPLRSELQQSYPILPYPLSIQELGQVKMRLNTHCEAK